MGCEVAVTAYSHARATFGIIRTHDVRGLYLPRVRTAAVTWITKH